MSEKTSALGRLTALAAGLLLLGCATKIPEVPIGQEGARLPGGDYNITSGDVLEVKLFYRPELNERVRVRPDGKISLQLIGEVQADGTSPHSLANDIEERYKQHLGHPETTVLVQSFEGQVAFIDGEVRAPGLVRFHRAPSLYQAVVLAGGLKRTAANNILVIRNQGNDRPAVAVIDMKNLRANPDTMDPFYLRPYDVVFVPKSPITKINDFVDQYIDEVIPQAAQSMIGFNWLFNAGGQTIKISPE